MSTPHTRRSGLGAEGGRPALASVRIVKAWTAQAEAAEPGAANEARAALCFSIVTISNIQSLVAGMINLIVTANPWLIRFQSSFYHVLTAIAKADRVLG